ncbi:MAG: beta-lactamase family protein [Actinobacteria bacterium]|nr:beta-lactamase family protein [Actinomycetota bacterium]MCB0972905.1 beta-lactamase family protein [Acidimicrobiales bacterium]
MGPEEAADWMARTRTTTLLVRVAGATVLELDRPEAGDGAYAIDGTTHLEATGELPSLCLPFQVLDDGRMRHDVASAQKSVAALLAAVAADRGLLDFDDPVTTHLGPGWSRAPVEHERAVTVRHLMSMTSGLDDLLEPVAAPGEVWRYGLGPTWHLVKRVVTAAAGLDLQEVTDTWLGRPLGLTDTVWVDRPGMSYLDGRPFEALSTTGRDLAAIGGLVLAGGAGIVSGERLAELLRPSQELNPAYGLLWWLNGRTPIRMPMVDEPIDRVLLPHAPADTVAMLGALGQLCHVTPSLGVVVVRLGSTTGGLGGMTGSTLADDLWRDVLVPMGIG